MKTIYKTYKLATTGKILTVSLRALFRATGIGGEVSNGEVPADVLDHLRLCIEMPNVSGLVEIKRSSTGATRYVVNGDELTIFVANLPAGISRLYLFTQYGTNIPAALKVGLVVRQNVPFLNVDGTYTPLDRLAEKDEISEGVTYYAYAYKYGDVIVWFDTAKLVKTGVVTAFVADGLDSTLDDATEEQGRVENNAKVVVYDEESDVELNVTDNFGPAGGGGDENVVAKTHAELLEMVGNGELVPGTWYRITDYVATTTTEKTRSAGHHFDILALALTPFDLSEECRATFNEEDGYFAENGCNLSAWKVWYSIFNDPQRFAWADETNGKGVVYRLIDEFNNDLPFDFKGIQFTRPLTDGQLDSENGTDTFVYALNAYNADDSECYDASVIAEKVGIDDYMNTCNNCKQGDCLQEDYTGEIEPRILPNGVCLNLFSSEPAYFGCRSWTCGNNCSNWTCGNNCSNWTCGNNCDGWTCGNGCDNWTCGNSCREWTCGDDCYEWTCGTGCSYWTQTRLSLQSRMHIAKKSDDSIVAFYLGDLVE